MKAAKIILVVSLGIFISLWEISSGWVAEGAPAETISFGTAVAEDMKTGHLAESQPLQMLVTGNAGQSVNSLSQDLQSQGSAVLEDSQSLQTMSSMREESYTFHNPSFQSASLQFFNVEGRKMVQQIVPAKSKLHLKFNSIQSGVYFILWETESTSETLKVVKLSTS